MSLFAFGLNHNTAPLDVRERVTIGPEAMPDALHELVEHRKIEEAAILSTCNRTEVYCSMAEDSGQLPIDWFSSYHGLNKAELNHYLYEHPDANAVKHILRVASGLDSMVLGEPQVLGQLKDAYQAAMTTGTVGQLLGRLFQHSFRVAKEIRTGTSIGNHPVSIAFAAIRLAQQIFGDLSGHTALMIGAGETIELAARHLHENGLRKMIIANRTLERSQHLASEFNAYAMTLGDIPNHLEEADIIISATASQLPILGKGTIENAINLRKHRPIFILDIAVPRDIEPEAGDLDDIYLYTVDDLKEVIDENMRNRKQAAKQAEEIIDTQVVHFMDWMGSLDAVSTIKQLRHQADNIQYEMLQTAREKLKKGADPEALLQEVTRTLTNKLIHSPSTQLRNAGEQGRENLLNATRELFNLDSSPGSDDKKK